MSHNHIHAPEHQRGMHVCGGKPACFVAAGNDPAPRGVQWLGNRHGRRPGWRRVWHDDGRMCMQAQTPELWGKNLELTPSCRGCSRAARALALWAERLAS